MYSFSLVDLFEASMVELKLLPLAVFAMVAVATAVAADEWRLVFADEFTGPANASEKGQLNTSTWKFNDGWSTGSQEVAYFTNRTDNVYVSNGTLKIVALHEPYNFPGGTAQYTAAAIQLKQNFLYGRFEASMKLPSGRGTHPSFWLLAASFPEVPWPLCGEIDVMENVGYTPDICYSTLHTEANNWERGNDIQNTTTVSGMYSGFVTYALDWSPDEVLIYIKGGPNITRYPNPMRCTNRSWPYDAPFAVRFQTDIGGGWGGKHGIDNSIFPATMEIDYIRIYQRTVAPTPFVCERYPYYLLLESSALNNADALRTLLTNSSVQDSLMTTVEEGLASYLVLPPNVVAIHDISPLPVSAVQQSERPPSMNDAPFLLMINFTLVNIEPTSAPLKQLFNQSRGIPARFAIPTSTAILSKAFNVSDSYWVINSFTSVNPWTAAPNVPVKSDRVFIQPSIPFEERALLRSGDGVDAAGYDFGGPGVGYADTTAWNLYQQYGTVSYRAPPDWVDITEISPGSYGVGFIVTGEFLKFSNLTFARSANYSIRVYYSNGMSSAGELVVAMANPYNHQLSIQTNVRLDPTSGWSNYDTHTEVMGIPLCGMEDSLDSNGNPLGGYVMMLTFPTPNYVLRRIEFVNTSTTAEIPAACQTPPPAPSGPAPLPFYGIVLVIVGILLITSVLLFIARQLSAPPRHKADGSYEEIKDSV